MVNNHEMSAQFGEWVIAKDHPPSIAYVVLSAFAAVVSYLIAHLFHLPEAYWAPMSTLIVMKLTLSAALPIAVQYVVGTALQARGLTENPFLHAWTEFGERKRLGQPEFPSSGTRIASMKTVSMACVIVILRVPRSSAATPVPGSAVERRYD